MNFRDNILEIDGQEIEMEFPIRRAKRINDLAVVIFDLTDKVPRSSQYQNCRAFDLKANHVWTAEHPTNGNTDYYIDFMEKNKLWNFAGFVCEIDFRNGKLIDAQFTK
ncbi:hypothetical protein [Croceimicrobium hydrocarbonivorans]|uniref:Uncharacterized protein n=1 Tax=Croceimicrobium hydrocarbonivorans TaxID=2761580 RepID=A0A7H0VFQ0_9FLAO|nr:hypothetical protein [Croceimicrobium hydrocarbonivorans]QNR24548.1 hypothetical protein H4K34_01525 [Croceimicrobium hydrocarbonivorans]